MANGLNSAADAQARVLDVVVEEEVRQEAYKQGSNQGRNQSNVSYALLDTLIEDLGGALRVKKVAVGAYGTRYFVHYESRDVIMEDGTQQHIQGRGGFISAESLQALIADYQQYSRLLASKRVADHQYAFELAQFCLPSLQSITDAQQKIKEDITTQVNADNYKEAYAAAKQAGLLGQYREQVVAKFESFDKELFSVANERMRDAFVDYKQRLLFHPDTVYDRDAQFVKASCFASGKSTETLAGAFVAAAQGNYKPSVLLGVLQDYHSYKKHEQRLAALEGQGSFAALQQARAYAVENKLSLGLVEQFDAKLAVYNRFHEDVALALSCKTQKWQFREMLSWYQDRGIVLGCSELQVYTAAFAAKQKPFSWVDIVFRKKKQVLQRNEAAIRELPLYIQQLLEPERIAAIKEQREREFAREAAQQQQTGFAFTYANIAQLLAAPALVR